MLLASLRPSYISALIVYLHGAVIVRNKETGGGYMPRVDLDWFEGEELIEAVEQLSIELTDIVKDRRDDAPLCDLTTGNLLRLISYLDGLEVEGMGIFGEELEEDEDPYIDWHVVRPDDVNRLSYVLKALSKYVDDLPAARGYLSMPEAA